MTRQPAATPPPGFGSWQDAETLRQWSFCQRTPQQRLDWLVAALAIRYQIHELKDKTNPS
jgi:hypothetical protein